MTKCKNESHQTNERVEYLTCMLMMIWSENIFVTTCRRREVGCLGFTLHAVETDGKTHGPPPGERLLLFCDVL